MNQQGIVWSSRDAPEKAAECLERAEAIYCEFREENRGHSSSTRVDTLDTLYTHTLFYLAQVYGQLKDTEKVKNVSWE